MNVHLPTHPMTINTRIRDYSLIIFYYAYLFIVGGRCTVSLYTCEGQRTTYGSLFSSSTMWVLEI